VTGADINHKLPGSVKPETGQSEERSLALFEMTAGNLGWFRARVYSRCVVV